MRTPLVWRGFGEIITIFAPRPPICSFMDCLLPSPIATIVMTAATPITMPSTDRNVLILFLSSALKAMRSRARGDIN